MPDTGSERQTITSADVGTLDAEPLQPATEEEARAADRHYRRELIDIIADLQKQKPGTVFEFKPDTKNGTFIAALVEEDGDRISARGATREDAVQLLADKIAAQTPAPAADATTGGAQ